jgi:hypothetical protein
MTELNKDEITVNGIPVKDLSAAGQKIFDKLVSLKKETDDLAALFQLKHAGSMELEEMSKTEEDLAFKAKLSTKAQELAAVAKQTLSQHEAKQGALKEFSDMLLTEVNEIKASQEVAPQ